MGIVDRQIEITEGVEYDKVSERDNSPQLFISFVMECGSGLRQYEDKETIPSITPI